MESMARSLALVTSGRPQVTVSQGDHLFWNIWKTAAYPFQMFVKLFHLLLLTSFPFPSIPRDWYRFLSEEMSLRASMASKAYHLKLKNQRHFFVTSLSSTSQEENFPSTVGPTLPSLNISLNKQDDNKNTNIWLFICMSSMGAVFLATGTVLGLKYQLLIVIQKINP